ncbi:MULTISPECIES: hypothetical protein [Bowmanella]|uniref:Uncharacterized protein n=2 Tax=Bowmanella TaxID=366580 RepID=A0A917Z3T2_9ALTE|nr:MULTISPECIES: hypothetical protein [Bowmanella]MBN7827883.1 hypothetical protein [Bowmanella dokdonensis]GGO74310.1 hypothetical protein GCM10010982_36840 [Bowmanella pacifica]
MKPSALVATFGLLVSLSSHAALNQDNDTLRYVFTYKLNKTLSYMEYQYQVVKQDIANELEDDIQSQVLGAMADQLIAANPPQAGKTTQPKVMPEQL